MKVLFQDIFKSKIYWDDELSQELKIRWFKTAKDISDNSYFEISHPYVNIDEDESVKIYDLHRFSDGNRKAYVYGACVYLPTIKLSGEVNVKLVATKPRVSPLNPHTIPRTELLENLLLVSLVNSIKKALESQVYISDHFYWTSSTVCIWWIKTFDKEYKTFVQNGVIKIHELSNIEKWNYVKSNSNPADTPERYYDALRT